MTLFPGLRGTPCGYLNIDDLARATGCTDPDKIGVEIDRFHKQAGWKSSYGGYLERRDTVWANVPYLKKRGTFLHPAYDFNVPTCTSVAATHPCVVVRVDDDHPEPHGWGKRIIVRLKHNPAVYLLYAHLGEVRCHRKQTLPVGKIIGRVGDSSNNGGWFPHLHVQALTAEAWEFYEPRLDELDGYGKVGDRLLSRRFPDPLPYLRVWG